MNILIPEVPMSPKLIKSSSCSSIDSHCDEDHEYCDIEEVIDKLMNDVCSSFQSPKRQVYKYVRVLQNQQIVHIIMNMIYYIFSRYNIIEYQKMFKVKEIYCMIDKKLYKLHSGAIKVFDNCFQLNKQLKIHYEYVKTVSHESNYITLDLIPNERNITKLYIKTNNNEQIFKKLTSNMKYHVQYHQINVNAIKYFQKFHAKPLEVY